MADGTVNPLEIEEVQRIAGYLGVSHPDLESIRSMFIRDTEQPYTILEIKPQASNEEVKKAYRQMAMKYHPDKVAHLGEQFQKASSEKFRKVNEAYEQIRKERGIK